MSFQSFPFNFMSGGTPIINQQNGQPTSTFYKWMLAVFNRTGSGTGIVPLAKIGLVASGSSQKDALGLTADWNRIDSGAGGVAMPSMQPGNDISVLNNTGSAINVYPFTGAMINGGGADAPYSLAPGDLALFEVWTTTQIYLARLTSGL
jgi:hypothetical protein